MIVLEYCALSMRMASDCMKVRGGDNDPNSPEEFLPILTEALPLVDEYLVTNSGDDEVKKVFRGGIEQMVVNYRRRWDLVNQKILAMARKTEYQVCQKCGTVFASRDMDEPTVLLDLNTSSYATKECPACFGEVVWQSSPEIGLRLGGGCLPALLLLGLLAALVVLRIN